MSFSSTECYNGNDLIKIAHEWQTWKRGNSFSVETVEQKLGLDIVYYSSVDWDSNWQRPQQFATRLARLGKMLYISPMGTRSVRPTDIPRFWNRLTARQPARTSGLTIQNPLWFLPFVGNDLVNYINGKILNQIQSRWMNEFGVREPILWVGSPSPAALEAVKKMRTRALVYDCMDHFPHFHNGDPRIAQIELQLAAHAKVVFASSKELYSRMKEINPQTYLLPNAADFEHFSRARNLISPVPDDIADWTGPVLGYYGELASWFDFDLVAHLARDNPSWKIVLIGKLHTKPVPELFGLPNVRFLGPRSYQQLPSYLSRFDVCLLPFKLNQLTGSANPVKLYEYLSAGKPVVSTPLNEVLPFEHQVEVAERGQFSLAVQRALETKDDEERIASRQKIAMQNTWESRIEKVVAILESQIGASA